MKTLMERFEDKFIPEPNSGCWLWIANAFPSGYGQIKAKGKPRLAHRVSWELYNGPIPEHDSYHGICVCHKCDNPSCVNPDHLFLGTQSDNVADQVKKGRTNPPKGESQVNAKLTEADVLAIRADPRTYREIAPDYGITHPHVSDIKNRKRWRHI